MNKQSYLLLVVLFFQLTVAQPTREVVKPDYTKIKTAIENSKLDSYYPKLMERMTKCDTTLQAEDYRNLYFGYTFHKDYSPYASNPYQDELRTYFSKDSLYKKDYEPFIKLANKALKKDPFELRVINMLSYVYHLNDNEDMSKRTAYVLNSILDTIFSTGDGMTCETGFHVISVSHEYAFLSSFQLESIGQSLVNNCDYLEFEKGRYKIDGMYFNVSKLFDSMMKKY